ncbi:hypothetical protein Tco_0432169 [Tanacetum coccineum]
MSNTNNTMQNKTSNTLHNAIMKVGGKDRPPMLAPAYKFKWTEKTVPVAEGSSETTIKGYMENYKNVSQDIRDQLNVEAETVQIILTGIDNDIYSTVDACPNACEMWKAIARFVTLVKQSQELKTVSYHKLYDYLKQHQNEVNEIRAKRLARTANPLALKIYKPTNNNLRTSLNTSRANPDNSPRINRGTGYENQRVVNVDGARENKPKRVKDAAYHKEKMLLYKQEEVGIQEVTPDLVDNSGPIFDAEPLHKVQNNNDNYNVFAIENEHPEQPESVNDIYLEEQGETNITIDSLDICYDREQDDQDDTDEIDQECDLLSSLIEKLKCKIDDSKNRNKSLETSNKALVDKLKDLKKFQAELERYHDVNYVSKVAIDYVKAKGDLMSCKIESEKSSNEYT